MNRAEIDTAVAAYWNARAPKFAAAASHVRHAEDWRRVLAAAFDATGPSDVVDLGCGTGACALIAASLGHRVRGYDGAAPMIEVARTAARAAGLDVEFVHGFLGRAAIAPASADIVTIRNVLWTLADPDAVLRLAFRVLRPGGRIVVSDGLWSVAPESRSTYPEQLAATLPFHKGLTEGDARNLLTRAGFVDAHAWHHLFDAPPYPGGVPFFVLSAIKPGDRTG